MVSKALVINKKDNVATATKDLEAGEELELEVGGEKVKVVLTGPVETGHKFAVREIKKGNPVTKYGETIGTATRDIAPGEHVHIHNVESKRGRGDRVKGAEA